MENITENITAAALVACAGVAVAAAVLAIEPAAALVVSAGVAAAGCVAVAAVIWAR